METPRAKVIETRVYKAYFDAGEFDLYAPPIEGEKLPIFSAVVLASDIKDAMTKLAEVFPEEIVQSIHCQTEGMGMTRGRIAPEKVVL